MRPNEVECIICSPMQLPLKTSFGYQPYLPVTTFESSLLHMCIGTFRVHSLLPICDGQWSAEKCEGPDSHNEHLQAL